MSKVSSIKVIGSKGLKSLGAMLSRASLAAKAGIRFGTLRNYYTTFGYKTVLTYDDFLVKYQRQDIVSRIIDAPPGATWSNPPEFSDKTLNDAWTKLNTEHQLWHKLQRADRLARLGQYSLLLFGFDNSSLSSPLNASPAELIYVRPIGMNSVDSITLENDSTSPIFGKPSSYKLKRVEDALRSSITPTSTSITSLPIAANAAHVVHVVENALDDEIFGIPIIERCFNLLDDLLKVTGGTAETFWAVSNRGMQADIDKDMSLTPEDEDALADEIDEYIHGISRVMHTRGVTMKNLGSDTPKPKEVFDMLMSLLSGTTGIPKRILIGSEAGQLASEQDRANWAERVDERNTLYAEPHILRPAVSLLQKAGVLPDVEYTIKWPSAFKLSPIEEGALLTSKGRAINNLAKQTGKGAMQITSVEEARNIVGLEGDLPASEIVVPEDADADAQDPLAEQESEPTDEGAQQE